MLTKDDRNEITLFKRRLERRPRRGRVRIRWTEKGRAHMIRTGSWVAEMLEQDALRYVRKGLAKPEDDSRQPVRMSVEETPVVRRKLAKGYSFDPHLTAVAWVMDHGRTDKGVGGAEFSNAVVIGVGQKLGYDIRMITEQDRHKDKDGFSDAAKKILADCDFVVMNNTSSFDRVQWEQLMILFFEAEKPFVRYEHDYGFCRRRTSINCEGRRDTCRTVDSEKQEASGKGACWQKTIDLYRHIFYGAKLSVFIGRDQERIHRTLLGDVIDPVWFLTPPIDTDHFKRLGGRVKRVRNSVVSMTGKLHHWVKGRDNVLEHIREHPEMTYTIYSEPDPETARLVIGMAKDVRSGKVRVKYLPPVPYRELPKIYNQHEYVIHMPQGFEPSGRTPIEGYLCGCKVLSNQNVGSLQLGLDLKDYKGTREKIKNGPYAFWHELDKRI